MRITNIGHAGLFLETTAGTVLCDPWFNPAYFASWFPFPANDRLDDELVTALRSPDYLYVSHLHRDHYDRAYLSEHVSKDATVLLPEYPLPHLRTALEDLGFSRFVQTRSAEPVELDGGLWVMIVALTAPNDGPIGDSCLAMADGTATVLNQNDARPTDLEALARFGEYDGQWLQFSGAIWYPMVYDLPEKAKVALGNQKRQNGMDRARRYVEAVGARHVFPHAGPPAFLDADLFELNDLGQPGNAFPDTPVFLEYLRDKGLANAHTTIPGTTVELDRGTLGITHSLPDAEVERIYLDKRGYLEGYRERWADRLAAERASWARGEDPLLPQLREWFQPLMELAPNLCARLGDRVLIDTGRERVVLDFPNQQVIEDDGAESRYVFRIDDALVRTCLRERYDDWVNALFLSCRFRASRRGPYNEHVYTWFKSLSPEKVRYVEAWLTEERHVQEWWRFGDKLVQRRCPHLAADLARFGYVQDGVLTCAQHDWKFDLETGRCLTSDDASLQVKPVEQAQLAAAAD